LVGTPYRSGGNTPQGGFDCSGLVGYVFLDVAGIVLPRTAQEISEIGAPDISVDRLESGDLVFFHQSRRVSHVGIYVGEGRFVHAPNEGGTVRLDHIDDAYWREHFSGAKRIPL
jgi:cell wall-associated NlpC family hydrolase